MKHLVKIVLAGMSIALCANPALAENIAGVQQLGDNHQISIEQINDYNSTDIRQLGGDTQVSVLQTYLGSDALENYVNVYIDGYDNLLLDSSGGPGIVQTGEGNSVSGEMIGRDNAFEVTQTGVGNTVHSYHMGQGHYSYHLQDGTDNYTRVSQIGLSHSASVTQEGDANEVDISQEAGEGNTAIVSQVFMEGPDLYSVNNSATIFQLGTDNSASIRQSGSFNSATVSQYLSNATANITSYGNYNVATILQQ